MSVTNKQYTLCFLMLLVTATLQHTWAQSLQAEKIDAFITMMMKKGNVPGLSVAVVHDNTVLLSRGYGHAGDGSPVTGDTPFAIASLSKAFTATLVMQLVEAGAIDLDAPLVTYIPSFVIDDPRGSAITVRQLLNQTSGLGDRGFPEMAFKEQPRSMTGALERMRTAKLVAEPGEKFQYHNPNYQLLAALVESVTNKTYSDYLREHVCAPLGMKNTYDFSLTENMYSGKEKLKNGHIFFLGMPVETKELNWFVKGAAGIVSTSTDMARWLILQLNNGRYENKELLSTPGMNTMRMSAHKTSVGYGMGWFLNQDSSLYHSGILWTYSAQEMIYMKEGYGVVVLFNGGMNAFADYYSFVQGIHDILISREPEVPAMPYWVYAVVVVAIFLLFVALCIRRLNRTTIWLHTVHVRARWKSVVWLALRLLPALILMFIPWMVTQLSGRVLSWHRIFLMFPDLILGLGVIAVLHVLVVLIRLAALVKRSRS